MQDHSMNHPFAEPFLSLVAKDLISRFGTDLSGVTVVFPSVRAGLFFNNYLYRQAQKSLWAPQYTSIERLFEQTSSLRKGDPIQLIMLLYETYIQIYNAHAEIPSTETLDEFFFFGEILLSDFDDVDKNLVQAKSLFINLKDLDDLKDDFSYLSDEQMQLLNRYFKPIFQGDSALKTAFRNVWNLLGEVYVSFRERLKAENMAYPGMQMRDVIENEGYEFSGKHYAFVGLNALSQCEERLLKRLKNKASFYWDYDLYYLETEAGKFVKKNIQQFGSALDASLFDTFLQGEKIIAMVASPSESGQSAVVEPWIDSLKKAPSFTQPDSAIVLCNEAILPVVMHAVPPEKVKNVNITMGFPLTQTAISSFLQVIAELQTKGYRPANGSFGYNYVLPVLRHPYASLIFPEAGEVEKELIKNSIFFPTREQLKDPLLFSYAPDTLSLAKYLLDVIQKVGQSYENQTFGADAYAGLYQESIFRAYQVVNRLYGILASRNEHLEKPTFLRLLKKLLSTVQIPFHGEPVKGLQIMGVLETRTLDFKNLLMLNVNEGFMPAGGTNENTFIPQFLRTHFGMNTIEYQESIFAYYFYRLIQRAEKITLVYNTDKTQMGKAEMSRFLLQLLVQATWKNKIKRFALQSPIQPWQSQPIQVHKDEVLMKTLYSRYDLNTRPEARRLSPSALNSFINCGYKFYLEHIKGLKDKDELVDEMDSSVFGLIFHRSAEYLYNEIRKKHTASAHWPFTVYAEDLEFYLKSPHRIRKLVLKAFEKEYFKGRSVVEEDFNGEQLLNLYMICKMLDRLILFDKRRAPFTIHGLEREIGSIFLLEHRNIRLNIGGIIDRLEEKEGKYYILDYKTSGKAKDCQSLEQLFEPKSDRPSHIFQTFVYALALLQKKEIQEPVVPALLYMQQAGKEDYSPVIVYNKKNVEDFRPLADEFKRLLLAKIDELFDPALPFQQTEAVKTCEYCSFREMCNR